MLVDVKPIYLQAEKEFLAIFFKNLFMSQEMLRDY